MCGLDHGSLILDPGPMSLPTNKINCLQAGRALAALAVVLNHAAQSTKAFASDFPGASILLGDSLGVDFFFVPSGFIIYHSVKGKSLVAYAKGRARRVYIPYLPIGLAMALAYTLFPGVSAGDRAWSWLPTLTLLPVQNPALSVAWTLQHELTFYAIFAVAYFSGRLALVLGLWGCAIILGSVLQSTAIPLALINLEFLMGVLVAIANERHIGSTRWYVVAPIPFLIWLVSGSHSEFSVLVGLSFACAILPTVKLEQEGLIRIPAALVFLGAASYSIYLAHYPMIAIVARFGVSSWWLTLALCIAAGSVAGVTYFVVIERPLLMRLSRQSKAFAPSAR